jgi:hypothetical protein
MYTSFHYVEQLVLPGTCLDMASFEGTTLHGYGESLLNGNAGADLAKTRFVEDLTRADIKICVKKSFSISRA